MLERVAGCKPDWFSTRNRLAAYKRWETDLALQPVAFATSIADGIVKIAFAYVAQIYAITRHPVRNTATFVNDYTLADWSAPIEVVLLKTGSTEPYKWTTSMGALQLSYPRSAISVSASGSAVSIGLSSV